MPSIVDEFSADALVLAKVLTDLTASLTDGVDHVLTYYIKFSAYHHGLASAHLVVKSNVIDDSFLALSLAFAFEPGLGPYPVVVFNTSSNIYCRSSNDLVKTIKTCMASDYNSYTISCMLRKSSDALKTM